VIWVSKIIHGDCLNHMHDLEDESIDAVVTDPPYGLAFMGKSWDDLSPKEFQEFSQEWGEEALRVLKPGGYLLAFCGTRTYHRMVTGLEDAGFTIKDQIDWLYGQGFPKSHNIRKAIQKEIQDLEPEEVKQAEGVGFMNKDEDGWHMTKNQEVMPEPEGIAKQWNGWGTALKPAHEPIVVAQKPYENTYAENVLKYGVGGLNIDGCRIGDEKIKGISRGSHKGRWPSNVIFDPKASELLDRQSGHLESGDAGKGTVQSDSSWFGSGILNDRNQIGDSGGASRFFYSAKAHKSERNAGLEDLESKEGGSYEFRQDGSLDGEIPEDVKNDIATLKPINLCRWLCRLVTPPDGTVLDPFAGSGTTGCACEIEGFDYILIEKRERFAEVIAPKHIEYWAKSKNWKELKEHEELPQVEELQNQNILDFVEVES